MAVTVKFSLNEDINSVERGGKKIFRNADHFEVSAGGQLLLFSGAVLVGSVAAHSWTWASARVPVA